MLQQLQSIVLPSCKHIQLRFRYRVDGSSAKVFSILLLVEGQNNNRPATVYDLLSSIRDSVLEPFLVLQANCVEWETVSITYPSSRQGSKQDILKLPLQGLRGLKADSNLESYELSVLNISLRFQGRPLPKQVKIHGICYENSSDFDALAKECAEVYIKRFVIPNTGLSYKLLFTVLQSDKSSKGTLQSKNKKKPIRKSYQYIEAVMCFWNINKRL